MNPGAMIPTLLPLFVAVAMRRAERRIHRRLRDSGAFDPQSAVPLSLSRSIERRRLEGLISHGAVRLTGNDRYFLDSEGWNRHQRDRRLRVFFAVSVVLALLGAAAAAYFILH